MELRQEFVRPSVASVKRRDRLREPIFGSLRAAPGRYLELGSTAARKPPEGFCNRLQRCRRTGREFSHRRFISPLRCDCAPYRFHPPFEQVLPKHAINRDLTVWPARYTALSDRRLAALQYVPWRRNLSMMRKSLAFCHRFVGAAIYFLHLSRSIAPTSSLVERRSFSWVITPSGLLLYPQHEARYQRAAERPTPSDLFDRCLEPCAAIRVFNGNLTTPGQFPRSLCPHQDVLTAISRCRVHRDPSGRSSATFMHSSAAPATTLS
jgi:hypothetical protein